MARTANLHSGIHQADCPGCGSTRPVRSLICCRECWSKLPPGLKLKAYKQAMADRKSIAVGDVALEVLATLAQMKYPPQTPGPQRKKQIRAA